MTASTYVTIRCDWPGCWAVARTYEDNMTDARAAAEKMGWQSFADTIDLCGPPSTAPKGLAAADVRDAANHAARTDHRPIVTPCPDQPTAVALGLDQAEADQYVKVNLSCACEWVVPAGRQLPEGLMYKGTAHYYWADHVKEATAKTADV